MTQRNKILIGIVAVVILLGAYTLFDGRSKEIEVVNNEPIATTTIGGNVGIPGISGDYTIEKVTVEEGKSVPQSIPNLDRPVTVSSKAIVTAEAKASATPAVLSYQAKLKQNPADFNSWINLGISQKEGGDYEGAVISWSYASKIAPSDYISLANIGNLYAYFLKDNGQAEVYYKQAISRSPSINYLYVQLAEIYRDIFKDLDKAMAIVDQGLSKIPNDPNLLQLKAQLD
jgi:hypothetical protein